MKKSYLIAALAACLVAVGAVSIGLMGNRAVAQQPGPQMAAPSTVLIDINYIFKKHPRFKAQMEEMGHQVDAAKADWKRENDAINAEAEQKLKEFRPGTPDYRTAEEQVVDRRTKLQGKMTLAKKDFLVQESKIYYGTYIEIMQEVQYLCEANRISVVLNFNREPINPENPDDVVRGINNKVVYSNPQLDISKTILDSILRRYPQQNPAIGSPMGVTVPR